MSRFERDIKSQNQIREKQLEEISRKHENPVDVWNFYDIILLVLKKYPNSCINMHLLHNWREVRCELCQM